MRHFSASLPVLAGCSCAVIAAQAQYPLQPIRFFRLHHRWCQRHRCACGPENQDIEVEYTSIARFGKLIREDTRRWARLVKTSGIVVD